MAVENELALLREKKVKLALAAGASAFALTASMAYANTTAQDEPVEILTEEEEEDLFEGDTVVVTGSRLRRSEFDSPKPLRVFETKDAKQQGLFTAGDILQSSSIAGGVQFDATFTGAVTDSGPGSATLNLRGLGADRTLILLNGRRLAPAGVQGAPTRPDLNLMPTGVIEQIDVLLDGASSIYGSDAVAGVANLITRQDFDGVELSLNTRLPEADGGDFLQLSFTAGASSDRGNVIFGAEYRTQEEIKRGDRDYTPCTRDIEENLTTGERRLVCQNTGFGSMLLDPGGFFENVGGSNFDFRQYWFDFGAGEGFFEAPVNNQAGGPGDTVDNLDAPGETVNGIGSRFVYNNAYNANRFSDTFDLLQANEFFSAYTGGEYAITDTVEVYFETLYANRSASIDDAANQAFPSIPCDHPLIQEDPLFANSSACTTAAGTGFASLLALPYLGVGTIGEVEVAQVRGVLGFRGDLEWLIPSGKYVTDKNFGVNIDNWVWDTYASFDHSNGDFSTFALNDDRLIFATQNVSRNGAGELVCDGGGSTLFGYVEAEECVPWDFTDPDNYINGALPQDFLDYAGGNATNRTVIEQTLINGVVTGDVFKLPDGIVPLVLGFEYREDSINSFNSFLITSGASPTTSREGDTIGRTELKEFFLETEIPVFKGRQFAEELTFGASARWTEDEVFGSLWTYGFNANYLPVEWLRLRGTYGTTFKAPNLRQQFLAQQIDFAGAFTDPCIVSNFEAIDDPEEAAIVRANCEAQGANPDELGRNAATSIPFFRGGNGQSLDPETSVGWTAGFAFEQPWTDAFDLEASVTYYEYEIEDSIIEPSTGFIMNDCIVQNANLSSPFCSRITRRNTGDPDLNFIQEIDASFLNSGVETAKGLDYSLDISKEFVLNDRPLDISWRGRVNQRTEREEEILGVFEDFLGGFGDQEFVGDFRLQASYDAFTFTLATQWVGAADDDENDPADQENTRSAANVVYDFGTCTVVQNAPSGEITGVSPSSCGAGVFREGFVDVDNADDWFRHDFAVNYEAETWNATIGVRNILDTPPPLVDDNEGIFNSANVPLGVGYDIFGRSLFATVTKSF
ncbi:TonB-dependent receptor [Parvularcula sp. ZS-1/3]|uniref:TonB-dependent receptor n=1 Tax=Parvularcula mediterranea TaxID=2732508 RepID=A0A7Y3W4B2_9PROT|nr:TonB-dependent receptor [Parvularcula mediterranea]NNU15036.1 TonB-dependent receptor [Parvularcula mediterranea]